MKLTSFLVILAAAIAAFVLTPRGSTSVNAQDTTCGCVPMTGDCPYLSPDVDNTCIAIESPCFGCRCVTELETPIFTCDLTDALRYEFTGPQNACSLVSRPLALCPPPTPTPCTQVLVSNEQVNSAQGDRFGSQVSIAGTTMVVSAPRHPVVVSSVTRADAGAIYVFTLSDLEWTQTQYIPNIYGITTPGDDQFGISLDFDGTWILVGAHQDDNAGFNRAGAAYLFINDGSSWVYFDRLLAYDAAASDLFGSAVAINGDWLAVSAIGDAASAGAVYPFEWDGTAWNSKPKLVASDSTTGYSFGTAISIDGFFMVIGSRLNGGNGAGAGAAYIFQLDLGVWVERQELQDAPAASNFGVSVLIKGLRIVVGADLYDTIVTDIGAVFIYEYDGDLDEWTSPGALTPAASSVNNGFGFSVAMEGDTLIVGAPRSDGAFTDVGSAYTYQLISGVWTFIDETFHNDPTRSDGFGTSCSISQNNWACGAPLHDTWFADSGAVYAFFYCVE